MPGKLNVCLLAQQLQGKLFSDMLVQQAQLPGAYHRRAICDGMLLAIALRVCAMLFGAAATAPTAPEPEAASAEPAAARGLALGDQQHGLGPPGADPRPRLPL